MHCLAAGCMASSHCDNSQAGALQLSLLEHHHQKALQLPCAMHLPCV